MLQNVGESIPLLPDLLDAECEVVSKQVQDTVFLSDLTTFLTPHLGDVGFAGCKVFTTHKRIEIIIRASLSREVLGERGSRLRSLAESIRSRYSSPAENIQLFVERVC